MYFIKVTIVLCVAVGQIFVTAAVKCSYLEDLTFFTESSYGCDAMAKDFYLYT